MILHELSHVGTNSIGETQEFWENFKSLLQVVRDYGAYTPVNYKAINFDYHGVDIDLNPLYIQDIREVGSVPGGTGSVERFGGATTKAPTKHPRAYDVFSAADT